MSELINQYEDTDESQSALTNNKELKCRNRLLPKKRDYRQRAHCNPLSDSYIVYPFSPDYVDWSIHFPVIFGKKNDEQLFLNTIDYPITYPNRIGNELNGISGPHVQILDIGCGYGGLCVGLATLYPKTLIMGLEIREKVTVYVGKRISALRQEHSDTQQYNNISVIRTNVMKFLVNYFRKGQISKMFFCFPDPHFKRSNTKKRIIGPALLSLYAYVLKEGGRIYTVTDVLDLHNWMRASLEAHPLFKELPITPELRHDDPCINLMESSTEEGKKVTRNNKPFYSSVFYRVSNQTLMKDY